MLVCPVIVYSDPKYPDHVMLLRNWIDAKLESKVADHATFIARVVNDFEPVAVCAFSSWTGDDIELSLAADNGSGTHGLVVAIFGYVFGTSGCARCTVRIRADNARSLKLARRLGFVEEGRQRKAKNGHDLIMFGMLKEECKWLAPAQHQNP